MGDTKWYHTYTQSPRRKKKQKEYFGQHFSKFYEKYESTDSNPTNVKQNEYKEITLWHITIRWLRTSDKEKILKAARRKKDNYIQRNQYLRIVDFSSEQAEQKTMD